MDEGSSSEGRKVGLVQKCRRDGGQRSGKDPGGFPGVKTWCASVNQPD